MSTLQITLPDELKAIADEQIAKGRFSSHSEYVRNLIEADQQRLEQEKLEALLVSRMEPGKTVEMDSGDWQRMREEFQRRVASRGSK